MQKYDFESKIEFVEVEEVSNIVLSLEERIIELEEENLKLKRLLDKLLDEDI